MLIESWADFSREMALLCEAYDRKHTKELDDAYWSALAKMQFKDFRRAAQYAREKAGTDGFDRVPKPGRFWVFIDEIRRAERPQRANEPRPVQRLSREQHLVVLHRNAITVAKRETMPVFKGTISRNVPDAFQAEYDEKWAEWDNTYGREPDSYWEPRARQLMAIWENKPQPEVFNPVDVLAEF